jgi:hypothetical protein
MVNGQGGKAKRLERSWGKSELSSLQKYQIFNTFT